MRGASRDICLKGIHVHLEHYEVLISDVRRRWPRKLKEKIALEPLVEGRR